MIIWGWGHLNKKYIGIVGLYICEHCNNEVQWQLWEYSVWFTFFFIPIFPYEFHRLLVCPICAYGLELDKPKFKELEGVVEKRQLVSGNGEKSKSHNGCGLMIIIVFGVILVFWLMMNWTALMSYIR